MARRDKSSRSSSSKGRNGRRKQQHHYHRRTRSRDSYTSSSSSCSCSDCGYGSETSTSSSSSVYGRRSRSKTRSSRSKTSRSHSSRRAVQPAVAVQEASTLVPGGGADNMGRQPKIAMILLLGREEREFRLTEAQVRTSSLFSTIANFRLRCGCSFLRSSSTVQMTLPPPTTLKTLSIQILRSPRPTECQTVMPECSRSSIGT